MLGRTSSTALSLTLSQADKGQAPSTPSLSVSVFMGLVPAASSSISLMPSLSSSRSLHSLRQGTPLGRYQSARRHRYQSTGQTRKIRSQRSAHNPQQARLKTNRDVPGIKVGFLIDEVRSSDNSSMSNSPGQPPAKAAQAILTKRSVLGSPSRSSLSS